MKKLLLILIAASALHAIPVVYADEELPQIAPTDDPEIQPLSPSSPDDYQNSGSEDS